MITTGWKKSTAKGPSTNYDRYATFSLELVFVNRIIKMNSQNILSKLLSFDVHPRDKKDTAHNYKRNKQEESGCSPNIGDCLEYFRKTEELDGDNSWYCNKCKDHV